MDPNLARQRAESDLDNLRAELSEEKVFCELGLDLLEKISELTHKEPGESATEAVERIITHLAAAEQVVEVARATSAHKLGCRWFDWDGSDATCNCGMDAALAAYDATRGGK